MSGQLEGVRRFVDRRLPLPHSPVETGRVVVVGSGKGGVGTSTVTALLALHGSAAGRDVLLVDAVDGPGAQHLLFGVRPERGLGALRGGSVTPRDLLHPLRAGLALLPAASFGDDDAPPSPAERRALFGRLASLFGGFELVVVDGGSRLDSVLAALAAAPARLLAIAAADRIAMAATHALVKAVGQRVGEIPVDVLVNRQDEAVALAVVDELREAAGHFLDRSVGYAGSLPEDACLSAGIAAGMSVDEAATGSPAAAAMHGIVQRLQLALSRPQAAHGTVARTS